MKRMLILSFLAASALLGFADGSVKVNKVEAHQRYPWNGLVDIVVSLNCESNDLINVACSFAATNSATGAAVPISTVAQNFTDSGSDTAWTRRYVWNATNDVGEVKIEDIALIVDAKVLGGVQLWENGPCWTECNVGATKPEDYGYYFWWGDTVGYKRNAANNGWVSVKDGTAFSLSSGGCPTYGMNNASLRSEGYIDSSGNLVAAHDAATAHLGSPWRMPTDAEFSALINNCNTTWTQRNGMWGRLVTGRGAYASKSIFLPAAGYGDRSYLYDPGSYGFSWSSTPNSGDSYGAWCLRFSSSNFYRTYDYRSRAYGQSVRPVREFANAFAIGAGVTTHLKFDGRTGVREPSSGGEILRYDASWYEGGAEARITEKRNGYRDWS